MREKPYTLPTVATVSEIADALQMGYKSFPVLNRSGQLVGMISSNFLIVLLHEQHWYSKSITRRRNPLKTSDVLEQSDGQRVHTQGSQPEAASSLNKTQPPLHESQEVELAQWNIRDDITEIINIKTQKGKSKYKDETNKNTIAEREKDTMAKLTRMERRASELDTAELPPSDMLLS